ncbi:4072_t:CDS:2 [Entrophospora sp. SA101]|nr:8055_t:CDS:2 [Entrophospora sp. SA101]CAJ0756341.1 13892_t:CDS:2 [Entrophospora sp. SA101]CAJ0759090.1 4072_t:CDS:2 [Entrophospora sp. SA101]CAJ0827928.1 7588_t:CDS:2 [Entrophospora sp. SA101]CAJ0878026.1 12411_t:CDS:2 [Entrophospora sp. SA101]
MNVISIISGILNLNYDDDNKSKCKSTKSNCVKNPGQETVLTYLKNSIQLKKPNDYHDGLYNKTNFCHMHNNCKFLLPYYPPLDESGNNKFFSAYIKLAGLLNRTLVLPNVGRTRISLCQKLPFDFYYDIEQLQLNYPDVKFITQHDFQQWTNTKHGKGNANNKKEYIEYDKPSTSHFHITNGADKTSIINLKPYHETLNKDWCLSNFRLNLNSTTSFKQIRAGWKTWESEESHNSFQQYLIDSLSQENSSNVLIIRHDTREQLLPGDFKKLQYSKHILISASTIIKSITPYIAVHWHMDHLHEAVLLQCTMKMLHRIQRAVSKTGYENIYLATNYPFYGNGSYTSYSSTWKNVSEIHHTAANLIKSSVPIINWKYLNVLKYLEDILGIEGLVESGVTEIIDKLVSINAGWYIGLPRRLCALPLDTRITQVVAEERRTLFINQEIIDEDELTAKFKNDVDRY